MALQALLHLPLHLPHPLQPQQLLLPKVKQHPQMPVPLLLPLLQLRPQPRHQPQLQEQFLAPLQAQGPTTHLETYRQ